MLSSGAKVVILKEKKKNIKARRGAKDGRRGLRVVKGIMEGDTGKMRVAKSLGVMLGPSKVAGAAHMTIESHNKLRGGDDSRGGTVRQKGGLNRQARSNTESRKEKVARMIRIYRWTGNSETAKPIERHDVRRRSIYFF